MAALLPFMASTLISSAAPAAGAASPAVAKVPFVGCASDGQVGPKPAPASSVAIPRVPTAVAGRLSYYASDEMGVLAPRGWRCFEVYGSNGSTLMVTPEDHAKDALGAHLAGPAVQISVSIGETSGRFEAARVAARLFPARKPFVDRVVAEGLEPASDFPRGPYTGDTIRRLGADKVEFTTPAGREGMGTQSRLTPSGDPIRGVATMDGENDATVLTVRLPPDIRDLTSVILDASEHQGAPR